VSTKQLRSLPERPQNSDVQITDDLHLVALTDEEYEAVMLFLKHSCEPNVGFAGNVGPRGHAEHRRRRGADDGLRALRRPRGGDGLRLRAAACRRRITGQDWKRLDLRIRYRGYLSWYLDRKMRSG
jgi:uncharacterized protein